MSLPNEILFDILKFFTRNDLEKVQIVNSYWDELIKSSNCLALRRFPCLTILTGPDGRGQVSPYIQLRYQNSDYHLNPLVDRKSLAIIKNLNYGIIEIYRDDTSENKFLDTTKMLYEICGKPLNVIMYENYKHGQLQDYVFNLENFVTARRVEFMVDLHNFDEISNLQPVKKKEIDLVVNISKQEDMQILCAKIENSEISLPCSLKIEANHKFEVDIFDFFKNFLKIFDGCHRNWMKFPNIIISKVLVDRNRNHLETFLTSKNFEGYIVLKDWIKSYFYAKKISRVLKLHIDAEMVEHSHQKLGLSCKFSVENIF